MRPERKRNKYRFDMRVSGKVMAAASYRRRRYHHIDTVFVASSAQPYSFVASLGEVIQEELGS